MIWGLDQGTVKPEITASEPLHRTSDNNPTSGATADAPSILLSQNQAANTNTKNANIMAEQKTNLPNFIDPIDLGPMLAPRMHEQTYHQIDATDATPIGATDTPFQQKAHLERHSNRRQELGVGLKPLSRKHDTFRNVKPLVSTQTVAGSSLPIIVLESQPQSFSVPTKRRQSAIEIAHQYRKTQGLFQPMTQSRWSSNSSYSPALQAIQLPALSAEVSEPFVPNQTRVYSRSADDTYLAPSPAVDSQTISAYGLHSAGLSRASKALASPGSDFGSCPRPPPNTPMNALAKSRMANIPLQINHFPASPDSPSAAIRALQHKKAAPTTRLSHRRLSAVLEASEDQNVRVDIRPLSPPPFQQNFHLSRPLIPDGIAHPSTYANLAKNRQIYHNQLENVSKTNAALLAEDFAKLTVEPFAPSWVQSQPQPSRPLVDGRHEAVKFDPQPPQRGHKSNKTALLGKGRGPGQKSQPQGQVPGRKNRSRKKVSNGMVIFAT
jgi:hypothetical protein